MQYNNKILCVRHDGSECWTQIKLDMSYSEIWEMIDEIFGKDKIEYFKYFSSEEKNYNKKSKQGELFKNEEFKKI